MLGAMTKPLIQLAPSTPFHQQDRLGHNRWHPDIRPGQTFRVGHPLSGPFRVEGAKPGDLLVVDIVDVAPMSGAWEPGDLAGQGWGYTGIFAPSHGGGLLHGHVPGVSFQGAPYPGARRERADLPHTWLDPVIVAATLAVVNAIRD